MWKRGKWEISRKSLVFNKNNRKIQSSNVDFPKKNRYLRRTKNGKIIYSSRSVDCAVFLPIILTITLKSFIYFQEVCGNIEISCKRVKFL